MLHHSLLHSWCTHCASCYWSHSTSTISALWSRCLTSWRRRRWMRHYVLSGWTSLRIRDHYFLNIASWMKRLTVHIISSAHAIRVYSGIRGGREGHGRGRGGRPWIFNFRTERAFVRVELCPLLELSVVYGGEGRVGGCIVAWVEIRLGWCFFFRARGREEWSIGLVIPYKIYILDEFVVLAFHGLNSLLEQSIDLPLLDELAHHQ